MDLAAGMNLPFESEWRREFVEWVRYWRNEPLTGAKTRPKDESWGPAYARQIGNMAAGLMQAEPPAYAGADDVGEDAPVTVDELASFTTEAVSMAAGQSVAFLRPTNRGDDDWTLSVLSAERVEFRFAHRQLVEAVVWRTWAKDELGTNATSDVTMTEHYTRRTEGGFDVVTQLWESSPPATSTVGGVTLIAEIQTETVDGERVATPVELPDELTAERDLFVFVWDWDGDNPVPIYVENESEIDYLRDLHRKEREDSKLPRTVVAVAYETLLANRVTGDKAISLPSGLRQGYNVMGVQGDQLAQEGMGAHFDHVTIDDDLVLRERITEVANAWYEACGIAPASIGRQVTGRSESGDAKRADSQLTLTTMAGPARTWRGTLNAAVASIWAAEGQQSPRVTITEGLKTTPAETVETVAAARSAQAMSVRKAVSTVQDDLTDDEIDEETARIQAENQMGTPLEGLLESLGTDPVLA